MVSEQWLPRGQPQQEEKKKTTCVKSPSNPDEDENKSKQETQIKVTDMMTKDIGHQWRTQRKEEKNDYKEMRRCNVVDMQAKLKVHGRQLLITELDVHKLLELGLFYFDRVAPSGCHVAHAHSVPCLADWGDAEIKEALKLFKNSGGYQNEKVTVNFVVEEQMPPSVQSEGMKNIDDSRISKIETTVCDIKSIVEELVVIVKSGMANSSIPKVMEKLETPQMPKQREVDHNQCNKLADIVAHGVVESTVVPIVEHVTNVLPPKHDVVVESMVLPTVEHVIPVLLPEPDVMVASKNTDENRILLAPSIFKLDSHLHDQTTQVQKQVTNSPLFDSIDGSSDTNGAPITHQLQGRNNKQNKMTVGLKNKRRKKIPKLQLVDESSSSTGPYGGRCTRRSDEGVESQYVRSPYIAIASNKRKAIPKKPTQTMLDLNAADSSLDTKEDKFDQDIVVMELFYMPIELATRLDLCSLQPKTWIRGSIINLVVAKLTNAQRRLFPDNQHILNGTDHAKLCDEYFGESRYTGKLHAYEEVMDISFGE
ncbi:unnamed protein product [Camellia sinensis]